jgi:hypothetical protein
MHSPHKHDETGTERGAALLIAIFALLLISVVGIAMIVTTGTDSALTGNYRTSTSAYYAALAGLEEARGRLLWKNQNYINITNNFPTLMAPSGLPTWGLTQVLYIVNPASSETVDPTSALPANYPDTEYQTEFGWPLSGAVVNQIASVSPATSASPSLPGQSFKWVRITPATEVSLGIDVDGDGNQDPSTVLYYDPAHVDASNNPSPGLISVAVPPPTAMQALEITSYSVMPSGSRRMLQYIVAPLVISPGPASNAFPAALTMDGNGVTFQDAGAAAFKIDGRDACSSTTPQAAVESIGYTNPPDYPLIHGQAMLDPTSYPGNPMNLVGPPPGSYVPTTPSIPLPTAPTTLRQSWETPATLDGVAQDIIKSADVVINGSATGSTISTLAPTMSAANPMTIVVNGDLNLNGWHNTGYGLLLVTGAFRYDPDANWNGLVLAIGQGIYSASKNGAGGVIGAVLVAKTRDSSGNLLPGNSLGSACFGSQNTCTGSGGSFGSSPGFGIIYNSCSVQTAQGPLSYKVLSFREIPLVN